jgi:Ca-activated chloride channel family protein
LNAPWVRADHKSGASAFLAHLKTRAAQERALALGLRPADPKVPIGSPIDAEHGCDPKQPQTLLEMPRGEGLRKLLEIFRELKKPSDVTLVFDKSGSMAGAALTEAKAGATAFLRALQPRDEVSILFFDGRTYPIVGPLRVGKARDDLIGRIAGVTASGGTALYEAIASAYKTMRSRAESDRGKIHALVVMTDGKDENSQLTLEQLKKGFPREEEETQVKFFTISYGTNASSEVLSQVAEAGDGSHSEGTVTNIVQVYRDIASFF